MKIIFIAKKINILSDIRFKASSNHLNLCQRQDNCTISDEQLNCNICDRNNSNFCLEICKFTVDKHVETLLNIQYDQANGSAQMGMDEMHESFAEHLDDVNQNDNIEHEENIFTDHDDSTVTTDDGQQSTDEHFNTTAHVSMYQTIEYKYVNIHTSEVNEYDSNVMGPNVLGVVEAAIEDLDENSNAFNQQRAENSHEPIDEHSIQMLPFMPDKIITQAYDVTQSAEVTTTGDFSMLNVQAEVDVETTEDAAPMMDESEVPKRTKRNRKQKPELQLYLKGLHANRSHAKSTSKPSINDPKPSGNERKSKVDENRKRSIKCIGNF